MSRADRSRDRLIALLSPHPSAIDSAGRRFESKLRRLQWGMKILLNGDEREIPNDSSVRALLELAGFAERRVAIEVNRHIVPRSKHAEHRLVDGDQVEIVHAIGGG